MRGIRRLSKWGSLVAALVAATTVSSTSHAALVSIDNLGSDTERPAVINSEKSILTNSGFVGLITGGGAFARDSNPAIGSFTGDSNLGFPIDFIALETRLEQGSGVVGEIFSDNIITVVGASTSGLLTFNYSNLANDNRNGIVVTSSDEGSLDRTVVTAVPLPAGVWLFLSALIGLAAVVRHNRKRSVDKFKTSEQATISVQTASRAWENSIA
jgi:hypothetical protein